MHQPYRICIIAPPGYRHSYAFIEVAALLKAALADCGHPCDITVNDLSPHAVNVILGYHLLRRESIPQGLRYIPYQLEQLGTAESIFNANARMVLEGAEQVWDYSRENIDFLAGLGIAAQHVPVGYHEALERMPADAPKDVDILFYGSMNARRKAVLDAVAREVTPHVKTLFGVYGMERDAWIARSHIVLNIHHYGAKIFEAVRLSYLLNNAAFVVSEESAINPYENVPLCLAPYDQLVASCRMYINNKSRARELGRLAYENFRRFYPMSDLLRGIV